MIKVYFKDSENMSELDDESIQFAIYLAGDISFWSGNTRIIDLSDKLVEKLKQQPEFALFTYSIPFWNAYVSLEEILRVLNPNGFLIINVGSLLMGNYTLYRFASHFRSVQILYPYVVANTIIDNTSLYLLLDFQATYNEQPLLSKNISLTNYTEHFFIFSKTSNQKLSINNAMCFQSKRPIFEGGQFNYCFHEETIAYLLNKLTNPNDWVLDSCAGSGMLGKVAESLGRNSVLYEINKDIYPLMKKNLQNCEVEWHCLDE